MTGRAARPIILDATPFAGEVGLDGKSRVPLTTQIATFRSVLEALRDKPRITTIHSYSATGKVRGTRLVVQSLCDLGLVGRGPL
ncbi:putative PAS/PAC sensor protein [Mycobacteroides abscessus subsp. abscessus]|nr:putative PAS/PAC sensor protein [Mycobacteroides abscessus subsp. abscessus]